MSPPLTKAQGSVTKAEDLGKVEGIVMATRDEESEKPLRMALRQLSQRQTSLAPGRTPHRWAVVKAKRNATTVAS